MSQNVSDKSAVFPRLLPSFSSYQAVRQFWMKYPTVWEHFLQLPASIQQELLDFCIGKSGLRITYDPVFRRIFQPKSHKERLESLLSSILGKNVSILEILPREGTRLTETGSFVIMDILVRLDDGSYANVEMQKIGYNFPLARADCYASDIIMRQYEKTKKELGEKFTFSHLHKVYCIILMEESPAAFHSVPIQYIHKRTASFNTGIYPDNAGLHEDIFICLDIFHSIVHTISKRSTLQEAWLTFFSATDIENIAALVRAFPMFLPIYQEITDFAQNPKELINMLSEALYIMDRNMERQMVAEMRQEMQQKIQQEVQRRVEQEVQQRVEQEVQQRVQQEVQQEVQQRIQQEVQQRIQQEVQQRVQQEVQQRVQKEANAIADAAKTEANIFRLRLLGRSTEEIAEKLAISIDKVNDVLASLTAP